MIAQDVATVAQRRDLHGSELYDVHRYEEAMTEIRASYELHASPNGSVSLYCQIPA